MVFQLELFLYFMFNFRLIYKKAKKEFYKGFFSFLVFFYHRKGGNEITLKKVFISSCVIVILRRLGIYHEPSNTQRFDLVSKCPSTFSAII